MTSRYLAASHQRMPTRGRKVYAAANSKPVGARDPQPRSKRPLAARRACQRLPPASSGRAGLLPIKPRPPSVRLWSLPLHLPAPNLDQVSPPLRLYKRLVRTRLPPRSPSPAVSPSWLQGRRGAARVTLAGVRLLGG